VFGKNTGKILTKTVAGGIPFFCAMKNVFLILLLALVGLGVAQAQSGAGTPKSDQNATLSDTLANATTDTQTLRINGGWKVVTVQLIAKELSGTAAGTGTIEVSNDGVNFVTHPDADTLTVSNTATGVFQSDILELKDFGYAYIRVKLVGTGTQSTLWYTRIKWAGAL
jgi:hypothetical protein